MSSIGNSGTYKIQFSMSGFVSVQSQAFTPDSISGLINWTEADSGAIKAGGGAAGDGDLVESVTRLGGTIDLAQSTGTAQPTYNTNVISGYPALTFDGSSDYLVANPISITGATASWVAVFNFVSAAAPGRLAILWNGVSNDWNSNQTCQFIFQNSATNWRSSRAGADRVSYTVGAAPFKCIVVSIYDGTNSIIWHNGVKQTPVACAVGNFAATQFFLGIGYSFGVNHATNFQVAANCLYSTALTDDQATQISNYFNDKYHVYGGLLTSLVSYWKLEEASGTRYDAHGSNHLSPTGTPGNAVGKIDNAAALTPSGKYLTCASNASLVTGDIDMTVAAWIYLNSTGSYQCVMSKTDFPAATTEYVLYIDGPTNQLVFGAYYAAGSVRTVVATNFGALSTGTWYHCVGWHDSVNNIIGVSVNDVENTTAHANGMNTTTQPFTIGAQGAGFNDIDGRVDEAGFWKRVLTDQERTDLYNGGAGLAYPFS